jgi:hypothetical protein
MKSMVGPCCTDASWRTAGAESQPSSASWTNIFLSVIGWDDRNQSSTPTTAGTISKATIIKLIATTRTTLIVVRAGMRNSSARQCNSPLLRPAMDEAKPRPDKLDSKVLLGRRKTRDCAYSICSRKRVLVTTSHIPTVGAPQRSF